MTVIVDDWLWFVDESGECSDVTVASLEAIVLKIHSKSYCTVYRVLRPKVVLPFCARARVIDHAQQAHIATDRHTLKIHEPTTRSTNADPRGSKPNLSIAARSSA